MFIAADSPPVKRAFAAAVEEAFPGVRADYFDGIAPPIYSVWLQSSPSDEDWLKLVATSAEWLAMARADRVLGLKGQTMEQAMPSSFARTAALFAGAAFDTLRKVAHRRGEVTCCAWVDQRGW